LIAVLEPVIEAPELIGSRQSSVHWKGARRDAVKVVHPDPGMKADGAMNAAPTTSATAGFGVCRHNQQRRQTREKTHRTILLAPA
jgi:hypothetical protein